jgi:hypothetical protein
MHFHAAACDQQEDDEKDPGRADQRAQQDVGGSLCNGPRAYHSRRGRCRARAIAECAALPQGG